MFYIELAIKLALEEYMEKIKQSGASFHDNNDSQSSQSSLFSFTDLSTHLFAAFASNDCPPSLFLDHSTSDDDLYLMSTSNDQTFKSILIGNKELHVPPGEKNLIFRTFLFSSSFYEFCFFFIFIVGFEHNREALAAAEIEQKMAEFQLEPIIDNTTNEHQGDLDTNQ